MGIGKQTCLDCHFLMKEYLGDSLPSGRPTMWPVDDAARREIRQWLRGGEEHPREMYRRLLCHKKVWGQGAADQLELKDELTRDRKHYCFFWKYRPGMFSPAAEELEKRERENAEMKRQHQVATVGLWIAAGALVVDVLFRIWSE